MICANKLLCISLLSLCAVLSTAIAQTGALYEVVEIGEVRPYAINNLGQVAGELLRLGSSRAFLWDLQNGVQDLGTLGGCCSIARGINDSGQVVGSASTPSHIAAFVWDSERGMQYLSGIAGSLSSRAYAINQRGDIVGYSAMSLYLNERATLWSQDQAYDFGIEQPSAVHAINDNGQAVGVTNPSRFLSPIRRAFVWDNGKVIELGALDTLDSAAWGINHVGQIVGDSMVRESGNFLLRPFLYVSEQGIQEIGPMIECPLGFLSFGSARAINQKGQVIGYNGCVPPLPMRGDYTLAAIWDATQGWQNLNDLIPQTSGWNLTMATAINDLGWIVGTGSYGGQLRGFVLIPQ